jgi:hypothetical protein
MDVVDDLKKFEAYMREWTETGGFTVHKVAAEKAALAIAEITRLRQDLSTAIERAAKVADNHARDGRTYKEYANEVADEIASSIRSLKTESTNG